MNTQELTDLHDAIAALLSGQAVECCYADADDSKWFTLTADDLKFHRMGMYRYRPKREPRAAMHRHRKP